MQGVPYQMVNGLEFYQRKEIKDVLAYLQLLNNPRDDDARCCASSTCRRAASARAPIDRLGEHAGRTAAVAARRRPRERAWSKSLDKRAAVAVAKFVAHVSIGWRSWRPVRSKEILGHVLERIGLSGSFWRSDDEEDQERLANIEELLTAARAVRRAPPAARATWRRFWKKPAWSTTPTPGTPTTIA